MTNTKTQCRIYVASLSDYNSGVLHGVWIDDCTDADAIQEEVDAMLRGSKYPNITVECLECEGCDDDCPQCKGSGVVPSAEEWAIHDSDGFGDLLDESTDFDCIVEHARLIEEHGAAWIAYCDHVGADYAEESAFEDAYCGQWDSEQSYAENIINECYNLDELMGSLSHYFDYESFTRDLFISDYYFDEDSGCVFLVLHC